MNEIKPTNRQRDRGIPRSSRLRLSFRDGGALGVGLLQLQAELLCERRRHRIAHLPVLVIHATVELKVVGEALSPCALPDRNDSVLLRMEDRSHFAHGARIGDGGGKVTMLVHPAVEALPGVVLVVHPLHDYLPTFIKLWRPILILHL